MDDTDAFRTFYRAHQRDVLRYVERRVADQSVAEEITAEAFTVAWRRWSTVEITLPWMYRTARNKIGDHYRRDERRRAAQLALERRAEEPPSGIAPIDRLALQEALRTLPDREREAILLTYWEGLDATEVAHALGASRSAMWTLLTRARGKLRGQLTPEEGNEPPTTAAIRRGDSHASPR